MGLLQLYYTSCSHGLSGFAGFQFNAVSPGVDTRLMREVEQLTSYQRPLRVRPGEEPVNLCHLVDASGVAVTAQVVYSGEDPSGRPGNYFAHALATTDPARDLDGLRPVELWGSAVWGTAPVTGTTELPVLDSPPEPGPVDRVAADDLLAESGHRTHTAACLLTAVVEAMAGGRPVVLRSETAERNALWIAAVCFLLDDELARRVSFVTYTSRADRSRVMLIGTIPGSESDAVTAALGGGFAVVDTLATTPPSVPVHPAATLLAAAGPIRAAGVWSQARELAAGTETGLDAWYPALAAAQALDGARSGLAGDELAAVVTWLVGRMRPAAGRLAAARAAAVLRVVLERVGELDTSHLRSLVEVARESGDPQQLDAIEDGLLLRALAALDRGEVPEPDTDPVTDRGRAAAAARVPALLDAADSSGVLDVLQWALRAGVALPVDEVRRSAHDVLGPALERLDVRRLAAVCSRERAAAQVVLGGIADQLAAGDGRRAAAVLKGEVGKLLDDADLSRHPKLREYLVVDQVRSGTVDPVDALLEIDQMRGPGDPALGDPSLLAELWPEKRWRLGEAWRLVGALVNGAGPALPYLRAALQKPPDDDADVGTWLALVAAACTEPLLAGLTDAERDRLLGVRDARNALAAAEPAATHDPVWFHEAEQAVGRTSTMVRKAMRRRLARAVLHVREPASALAWCTDTTYATCCELAREMLAREPRDVGAAANWVGALAALRGGRRYRTFADVLAPGLDAWSGKEQRALRKRLLGRPVPEPVPPTPKEWKASGTSRSGGRSTRRPRFGFRRPRPLADLFDQLLASEEDRRKTAGSGRR